MKEIFYDRFDQDMRLIDFLKEQQTHVFHLTKIAADREIRCLFKDSSLTFEDFFELQISEPPFKPKHLPYMFMFMDNAAMYESVLAIIRPAMSNITGADMIDMP